MDSPFAEQQHRMSAQIYSNDVSTMPEDWRCSSRIPNDVALTIYQRNLRGGVAQHLQAHFPVAYRYIGRQAYHVICSAYLQESPPDQTIFTLYAAHFPGFLLEYGELQQQFIWVVTAQLAQIDFFHHNAFCENQRIDVEKDYYQLWLALKSIVDSGETIHDDGLYQIAELHPEHYKQHTRELITLVTFWQGEELFFRVE